MVNQILEGHYTVKRDFRLYHRRVEPLDFELTSVSVI